MNKVDIMLAEEEISLKRLILIYQPLKKNTSNIRLWF